MGDDTLSSLAKAAAATRRPVSAVRDGGSQVGRALVRDRGGCWVTDQVTWHDFRDSFRPGIGQEEWPRICG